jgi:hypothetical protein
LFEPRDFSGNVQDSRDLPIGLLQEVGTVGNCECKQSNHQAGGFLSKLAGLLLIDMVCNRVDPGLC